MHPDLYEKTKQHHTTKNQNPVIAKFNKDGSVASTETIQTGKQESFRMSDNTSWTPTRKIIHETFEKMDVDCKSFKVKSIVTSSTAVKHTLMKANIEDTPTVSILSKHIIAEEIEKGILYTTKMKGLKLTRMLYLCYIKDRKHDALIDNVINYIMSKQDIKA